MFFFWLLNSIDDFLLFFFSLLNSTDDFNDVISRAKDNGMVKVTIKRDHFYIINIDNYKYLVCWPELGVLFCVSWHSSVALLIQQMILTGGYLSECRETLELCKTDGKYLPGWRLQRNSGDCLFHYILKGGRFMLVI